jgi:hypothetical protein
MLDFLAAVNDVCDWVDGLGLSQYRKKFMHHVINGRLLLRLNDALLKTELAIGPLVRFQAPNRCTPWLPNLSVLPVGQLQDGRTCHM